MCKTVDEPKARPAVGCTELLERIVRSAFAAGENWGVTYSTWFTPSKADAEKKIQRAIVDAKKIIRRSNAPHEPARKGVGLWEID